MDNVLKTLANGFYYFYKLEEGGAGIVYADNPKEAEFKVRDAYSTHSDTLFTEEIEIFKIYQKPYEDAPDVIEIYEN